ncbi:MAG: 23S rRNA (pseudouridine(1915)-N(3))-methyltransferase RlmH [Candidatus Cloacimonetes bacterium]|nr:23S rRNA (pseudouridine(1915)-N(3))-methyltransferase RlmH [Candidatus Cloacimonadota bacterium]
MKIRILCVGKSKQKFIEEGVQEYLKRISKFISIRFEILPDVKLTKTNTIKIVKNKEAEIIEKHLSAKDFTIALDENGSQFSSQEFSELIKKNICSKKIVFIIGGVYGLSEKILRKADLKLSFSKFTFTHQMIRMILTEQIYRAFTIIQGKKYHY